MVYISIAVTLNGICFCRQFKENLVLIIFKILLLFYLLPLGVAAEARSRIWCDAHIADITISSWLGGLSLLHYWRTHGPLKGADLFILYIYINFLFGTDWIKK